MGLAWHGMAYDRGGYCVLSESVKACVRSVDDVFRWGTRRNKEKMKRGEKEGYTNRAMEKSLLSVSFPCEMSILVYLQKVLLRMLAWMCEGGGGSGGSGGGGGGW